MIVHAESRLHVFQIEAETGKPVPPPECILLEFNLEDIFGKKFFPLPKTERAIITSYVYVSSVKSGTRDITFEMHGICGIKKILIAGFATKYHLERTLELLKPLGVVHILNGLPLRHGSSGTAKLLHGAKKNFNINLCLSGDLTPILLERGHLNRVFPKPKPRA